jgi:hypothetical protein
VQGTGVGEGLQTLPLAKRQPSRGRRVEIYRPGVNSYIVKPVDFDKFVEAVGELGPYWLVANKPPV